MGNRASAGFTIIETILFLAVTGALIGGMMFATSMTLGTQRYSDAVESFKSLMQQQYAGITSVQNGRDNDLTCTSQAATTDGDVLRGQSDCVIVGKYIIIDGGDVTIYPVLAYEVATASDTANDVEAFRDNYYLNLAKQNVVETKLEWDAQISWATAGNPDDQRGAKPAQRTIGVLLLRSPSSGQTYTFTSDTIPTESQLNDTESAPAFLSTMLQEGTTVPGQKARTICINSGGLTSVPNTSLYIAAYAAGQSAVEVRSNDVAQGLGAPERC